MNAALQYGKKGLWGAYLPTCSTGSLCWRYSKQYRRLSIEKEVGHVYLNLVVHVPYRFCPLQSGRHLFVLFCKILILWKFPQFLMDPAALGILLLPSCHINMPSLHIIKKKKHSHNLQGHVGQSPVEARYCLWEVSNMTFELDKYLENNIHHLNVKKMKWSKWQKRVDKETNLNP